jgi:predicted membrane protein
MAMIDAFAFWKIVFSIVFFVTVYMYRVYMLLFFTLRHASIMTNKARDWVYMKLSDVNGAIWISDSKWTYGEFSKCISLSSS